MATTISTMQEQKTEIKGENKYTGRCEPVLPDEWQNPWRQKEKNEPVPIIRSPTNTSIVHPSPCALLDARSSGVPPSNSHAFSVETQFTVW
jgi:hypothetical protein